MVALNDAAVRLRFAGLDHLISVVRDEELKAVLGNATRIKSTSEPLQNHIQREKFKRFTGFFESSTSRMLKFSKGMIPLGSLSFAASIRRYFIMRVLNGTKYSYGGLK